MCHFRGAGGRCFGSQSPPASPLLEAELRRSLHGARAQRTARWAHGTSEHRVWVTGAPQIAGPSVTSHSLTRPQ